MVQVFNVSRGVTAARSPWRRLWQMACIGAVLCAAAGGAWAQSSDLVLAQHVVSPDPVPAGGIATITMTVQNNGTGAASNVKLTDTIPAGSTFIGMTANSGGACAAAVTPGDYECSWASIPYPGSRIVTLQVQLPTSGVWPNAAKVESSTTDPNPGNNALNRNITVVAAADLRVDAVSSVGVGTIAAGTPYTYTVNVSNQGPDGLPASQAPTVTFNVPAGSSITSRPTGTGWTCTPATGYPLTAPSGVTPGALITCTRSGTDSLANGASFLPITVPAVANVTGTVTAGFDVQSNFPDGNTTNNTTTVDVALTAGTDMSITKTAAMAAVGGVTRATFTLQARQNGGSTPTNVTVTDTLPIGLDYVGVNAADPPWSCSFNVGTRTLTCTYIGSYTGGPFTDLLPAIELFADVSGVGDIPNTGTVFADQADPVGSNDTSTVYVNNSADLGITKSASVSPVVVGTAYNWGVVVRNYGPMPVLIGQTITVTETIPVGMQVNSAISNANWTCSGTYASGPNSGNAVTYPTSGESVTLVCTHTRGTNLAVNADAPTLTVPVTNTVAGNLSNTACLGLSGTGPVEAGDTVNGFERNCHTTGITGTAGVNSADLQITKSASPNPVVVGDQLTYTLTATNLSTTVAATSVHVYDTVNNLLTSVAAPGLVSITTTQGTCTRNAQGANPLAPANVSSTVIDCDLGTLAPAPAAGSQAIITITVRPHNNTAATLSRGNTADINSLDIGDPNRANNRVTINSDVLPRVDATVTKTVNPSSNVRVGQPMVYTITARNGGPSTANKLIISDPLPPNTAFVSRGTPSDSGTCTQQPAVNDTTGTLVCEWANVPSGGNRTVTMTVRALAAALNTTVRNTVTVSVDPALDTETDTANNSSFADAPIIDSLVDILVQKTDGPDPVPLGGLTTYTVTVRNTGPSIGTNLVVTDTFPNTGNTARFSYQGNLTATVAGVAVPSPACTQPAIGAMTGTLECTFPAIAIGIPNEVVLTYQMRAESIITAGDYSGTQGNHVAVRVDENETQLNNNQVDEDTTTSRVAPATPIDLGIVKTTTPGRALPGTEYDYTLTVTNHEASGSGLDVVPANGAQVTDTLPAGLTFVSAPGCSYSAGTRQVVCVVSNLAAAANVAFTVRVRLDSPYTGPASLSNTAAVDIPGDPVPGNNTSTVPKDVGNPPPPAAIPTLSEWGLILLSLLLGVLALRQMPVRRRW